MAHVSVSGDNITNESLFVKENFYTVWHPSIQVHIFTGIPIEKNFSMKENGRNKKGRSNAVSAFCLSTLYKRFPFYVARASWFPVQILMVEHAPEKYGILSRKHE
jgi:hypothetical protein